MKKLKLRIVKFDKLLVVEQLELEGEFIKTYHTQISGDLYLHRDSIDFREYGYSIFSNTRIFVDNQERDEYFENLIKWITEEQFGDTSKLEVGKECWVSENGKHWEKRIFAGKTEKQLGYEKRFLAQGFEEIDSFWRWKYAKPLNSCLEVDGDIYTWEKEE